MAQHQLELNVGLNLEQKKLVVHQKLVFWNQTTDTLHHLLLNDWNNAYSDKNSPLGQRFSDEFYRGFHLASDEDRGGTINLEIRNNQNELMTFYRDSQNMDYVEVKLQEALLPNQKTTVYLTYESKISSDEFTKFGIGKNGDIILKNCFLMPSRFENHQFVRYNNLNLDDIANGICDTELQFSIPKDRFITSDLDLVNQNDFQNQKQLFFSGKRRTDFSLFISSKPNFISSKLDAIEVISNMESPNLEDKKRLEIIAQIEGFISDFIGKYPYKKIIVSQTDYDRNPFYGLNQLPSFLNPFDDKFQFEIKFLKNYSYNFLKNSLHLDPRKDNWIYDALQMHAMIAYIDRYYPEAKMLGSISKYKILKHYTIANLGFNEQYSYYYMLMARKNLDQKLISAKDELIKFNEQIANKYKAGLSIRFLDSYLQNDIVTNSIKTFYSKNLSQELTSNDFESLLKSNSPKNIDWFFSTVVNSRELIDYKFSKVSKTKDSIQISIKNKTEIPIPIPIYGLKKGQIVFKKWLDLKECDSTFTIERKDADRLILNYKNEVPEYNLRNNWKKLQGFFPNNRPIKFQFMKDLEDPYYNQVFYVPTIGYNLYDGLTPGMRLHNRSIIEKPFIFDFEPALSTKTKNISGGGSILYTENYRNSRLFNIRYLLTGSYSHYAPDAIYSKITPSIEFRIREPNFRDNKKETIILRQVIVNKEKSLYLPDDKFEKYSVFNAHYNVSKTEVTHHFSYGINTQFASNFGKLIVDLGYRKLFENNRQLNLRLYSGCFLYNNTNSDFYNFALDHPSDYLFDYNYYGRSESSGFFSQQYIQAEGGFKSKIKNSQSNQWLTAVNASANIWNWVEVYGDVALLTNKIKKPQLAFDSGIRFNLVPEYFELYFPVLSTNGFEIKQPQYTDKIRFVITFSPSTLINLFNRKWF